MKQSLRVPGLAGWVGAKSIPSHAGVSVRLQVLGTPAHTLGSLFFLLSSSTWWQPWSHQPDEDLATLTPGSCSLVVSGKLASVCPTAWTLY